MLFHFPDYINALAKRLFVQSWTDQTALPGLNSAEILPSCFSDRISPNSWTRMGIVGTLTYDLVSVNAWRQNACFWNSLVKITTMPNCAHWRPLPLIPNRVVGVVMVEFVILHDFGVPAINMVSWYFLDVLSRVELPSCMFSYETYEATFCVLTCCVSSNNVSHFPAPSIAMITLRLIPPRTDHCFTVKCISNCDSLKYPWQTFRNGVTTFVLSVVWLGSWRVGRFVPLYSL